MAVDGPDGRPATFHAAKHWGNRDVIEKLRRARDGDEAWQISKDHRNDNDYGFGRGSGDRDEKAFAAMLDVL